MSVRSRSKRGDATRQPKRSTTEARSLKEGRAVISIPSPGAGATGHGVLDVAVRMKKRRGLLTEPSQRQTRPSRRRCDPGLRHSLTEEHGPVEDSLTVAPRSSFHESAGFLALVAERPPKVAVGFHPRSAIPPNDLVAERRWNPLRAIGVSGTESAFPGRTLTSPPFSPIGRFAVRSRSPTGAETTGRCRAGRVCRGR